MFWISEGISEGSSQPDNHTQEAQASECFPFPSSLCAEGSLPFLQDRALGSSSLLPEWMSQRITEH